MPVITHFNTISSVIRILTFQSIARVAITIVMLEILFSVAFTNPVFAQERVYTYSSEITVLPNRSLDVIETITVYVENIKIRHGIYRDFDTFRVNQKNEKVAVDLRILDVTRNGVTEQFHTRKQTNKVRVFFGSKTKLVSKGIQTYIIHYVTTNQLNSYNNKDEFYWNASGNKWSMPIFRVEATIVLPTKVKRSSISFNAYSGYTGVNKQDYISSFTNNHTIKFALNRKYLVGDGLTIAIAWPAGLIDAAPVFTKKIKVETETAAKNNQAQTSAESNSTQSASDATLAISTIETVSARIQANIISKLKKTKQKTSLLEDTKPLNGQALSESNKPLDPAQEVVSEKAADKIATVPENKNNSDLLSVDNLNTMNQIINSVIEFSNNLVTSASGFYSQLEIKEYIGLIGVVLLLIYFISIRLYLIKTITSKDALKTLNAQSIPDNLSPASIRYINEMAYDDRTFATALINIAVKGHIDIIKIDNTYKIERRDFSAADELSNDEKLLISTLMGDESVIQLTSKNYKVIHDAMDKHQELLVNDHKKKYFEINLTWFNIGIAITLLTTSAIALLENNITESLTTYLLLSCFALWTFASCYLLLDNFKYYNNFKIDIISNSKLASIFQHSKEAYIFALLAFEFAAVMFVGNYIDFINIAAIGAAAIVCAFYSELLITPNIEGKNILNKISMLKEFITNGEILQSKAQYDSIQISQTISAFDNYLPYTIALGVETEWGNHYSLLFDNNHKTDDDLGYSPHWYHGSDWKDNNTTGFCESLSSKFTLSAASAAKTPKYDFDTAHPNNLTKH